MANPLISQGTLNRLRGSVTWSDHATLNVTSSYLGRDGIRISLQGDATTMIPTLTGAATSPEPFQLVEVTINLLKTQSLSDLYKSQMESTTLLGTGVVRTDTSTLSAYEFTNCAIKSVRELSFNGTDPNWVVVIGGYYLINSDLWNA